jgi:acetoin utilization deacetylase AcuC-like enzyme
MIFCLWHSGNGNAALFDKNERVQTFSMHCSGNYFSKKEKSDFVELPIGCDDETYLSTLRYWLKRVEQHRFDESIDVEQSFTHTGRRKNFDLIFFQSGVDIHKDDRLGRLHITAGGISKRNAMIFDFAYRMNAPLVLSMGGGYPKDGDWSPIIESHIGVYWEAHQYLSTIVDSSPHDRDEAVDARIGTEFPPSI